MLFPICFILAYFGTTNWIFLKFSLIKIMMSSLQKNILCSICFGIRLFIWWMNLCNKLYPNKAYCHCNLYEVLHEFWWHDFNILHMDLCGTLCTPGQVLEDSSLLEHKNMILLNELMLIWNSSILTIVYTRTSVHQDKCLKTLHYLNIKTWFY